MVCVDLVVDPRKERGRELRDTRATRTANDDRCTHDHRCTRCAPNSGTNIGCGQHTSGTHCSLYFHDVDGIIDGIASAPADLPNVFSCRCPPHVRVRRWIGHPRVLR